MHTIDHFFLALNGYVWGPLMLALLVGVHLLFTFRLRFIQRYLPRALMLSFKRDHDGHGDISPFGSLSTAMATTIGIGSIIGVAAAISLGGPGALFWMIVFGILAVATKYAEALLAVKYRRKNRKGTILGGPMLVFENGLHQKWLGFAFCIMPANVVITAV
jgi:AGCS family alanine or glycine:cation symporter